jgi:hypothetical protein
MEDDMAQPSEQPIDLATLEALRREEGLRIDPTTAELHSFWGNSADPYGERHNLPEDCYHYSQLYFARQPDGDMWVEFRNLSKVTVNALWERINKERGRPHLVHMVDQVHKPRESDLARLNAQRHEEGLRIDPTTAELTWEYGQILDPYGDDPDLPEECYTVGRVYFACRPEGGMWVCFYDLPEATTDAIWQRINTTLAL